jgi:hypothetical protein
MPHNSRRRNSVRKLAAVAVVDSRTATVVDGRSVLIPRMIVAACTVFEAPESISSPNWKSRRRLAESCSLPRRRTKRDINHG